MTRLSADDLRAEIRSEARAAGIKGKSVPSLRTVRRRRRELLSAIVGVVAGVALVGLLGGRLSVLSSSVVRTLIVAAGATYAVTLFQRVRRLATIESLLADLSELETDAAQRVIDHVVLADVDDGLRRSLLVEDTLDGLLDGAVELTQGAGGTLYLLRPDSTPSVWTRRGDAHPQTHASSAAARVAVLNRPLLVDADGVEQQIGGTRILTPLVVNGVSVGIIEVEVVDFGSFDGVDLELLHRYAHGAALALDGSILYADAMERVATQPDAGTPSTDPIDAPPVVPTAEDDADEPEPEPERPAKPAAPRFAGSSMITPDGLSLSEDYF